MSPTIHARLVQHSVRGRYDLFLGLGAGLTIFGLILFLRSLGEEPFAVRAWQLVHVNWIYFTGLAGGSVAFAAVQKVTNAKWSGLIIRFAEAAVAFLPVSLIGLGSSVGQKCGITSRAISSMVCMADSWDTS